MTNQELMYACKIGSKVFTGQTSKEAYMKAVKWYATAVISHDHIHDIHVEFIKDKDEPKVTVVLWAALSESTTRDEHCKVCREVHTAFYSNTGYDCNRCNVLGYLRRLEQKAIIKVGYCRDILKREGKGGSKQ